MKKTALLFVLLLISVVSFSQSLEGEWKGYFTYNEAQDEDQIQIVIQFKKINDTTFEGVSKTIVKYSKKESDTALCILKGGFHESNILLLEETRPLKDFKNSDGCLQLMKLYYTRKKKYIELKGDWFTENAKCGSGQIRLTKSNN